MADLRRAIGRRLQPRAIERWPAIIISLHIADAFAVQDRRLRCRLDALGHGVKAEPLGEAEQMAQENLVVGAGAEIVNERAVDLDRVDRQRLQMP